MLGGPSPRERFPLGPGDEEKSFEFGGRQRTYLVHRPAGPGGSTTLPAVLVLHGGIANAYFTAYSTGMSATADREGFIAVYPNGTGRFGDRILTWNVGFGFGYALRNHIDDVGFLREVIRRLVAEDADSGRIYVTGISNGGIMSYRMASEASDLVAAVAPVAGAAAGQARAGSPLIVFPKPARPVSVMAFHGTADRLIPYDGGAGAGLTNAVYPPVRESVERWVGYDGCSTAPAVQTSPNGNVVTETYSGGREGSEVMLCTIRDGGHSWPGGRPLEDARMGSGGTQGRPPGVMGRRLRSRVAGRAGEPTQEISANDITWTFFRRHVRT